MNIKKDVRRNTYYFSISLGTDAITGKRQQTMRSGFKTKKEAEKVYNQLKHKYFEGNVNGNINIISFSTLVENYTNERKHVIKKTTFKGEQAKINTHIISYFKDSILHKLERHDIVTYHLHLQSKNLSENSINKIMLTLKQLFDYAIKIQAMNINHCISIPNLKVKKTEMNFWTIEDFKVFISYVKANGTITEYLFFTMAYMTGARLSELLGCQWDNINISTSTWRIAHSFHLDKDLGYYLDTPKTTASNRSITLNKQLMSLLLAHRQDNSTFVFAPPDSFPQRTKLLKAFYRHTKESNVPNIRFHDLRHSHVALLIDMKEQDFIIKERLGHASIRITYDIYGHLFPTRQHELADRLDNLF